MICLDPLEVELLRRTRWLSPALNWSVRFANHGPVWLPRPARVLPLHVIVGVYQGYVRWLL